MAFDAVLYALNKSGERKTAQSVSELEEHVNQILPGYDYKGSVATTGDLPNDATIGDMYTVTADGNEEYVWNGEDWIKPNRAVITHSQIDSLYT